MTGQFVDAREQLTKMFRYSDLDSGSRVPLLAIEVANNVALGMPKNVQSSFDTLQQVLGKQASDFTLTWRFSAIKLFIGKNQPFARHRSWILAFFESLESKQRDDMQTAVNSARSEFLKTAEP